MAKGVTGTRASTANDTRLPVLVRYALGVEQSLSKHLQVEFALGSVQHHTYMDGLSSQHLVFTRSLQLCTGCTRCTCSPLYATLHLPQLRETQSSAPRT
jgi:hypothetical protein